VRRPHPAREAGRRGRRRRGAACTADSTELIDLAALPDGGNVSLITRRGSAWQLARVDLAQPGAAPQRLLRRDAPLHRLRHGARGIEFIAAVDGENNVWRLQAGTLQRLTHSHTAGAAHTGSAADGSLATLVVAAQGHALHRLGIPAALRTIAADTPLGAGAPYSALCSIYPRAWLPAITADRGLAAFGAATSGGDALGWYQYTALLQWESSQQTPLGSFEYRFVDSHGLALSRTLAARAWTGGQGGETTTVYDRRTQAQWLSHLPPTRLERRLNFGIGAALDRIERVVLPVAATMRRSSWAAPPTRCCRSVPC
jgi:hypothetical protein